MQWLRDGLKIIASAPESGALAAKADPGQDVYLVPAFVGLGAPYWNPEARGAMFGLTRATGPNEIARAALEAVCYQTRDLLDAMKRDWTAQAKSVLRVDGGMVASDWTMQCLADILDAPVERPTIGETTALGAAWLAGQRAGVEMAGPGSLRVILARLLLEAGYELHDAELIDLFPHTSHVEVVSRFDRR